MLLFEYGVDSPQFGTVLLSVVAAFLSVFTADRPPSARKTGARAVAIALLAVLSVVQGGALFLTVGLLLFAAGDALLVQEDEQASSLALVFFVAGHVAYAALLFPTAQVSGMLTHPLLVPPLAVGLIAFGYVTVRVSGLRSWARGVAVTYIFIALADTFLAFATRYVGVGIGSLILVIFAWCILALRQHQPSTDEQDRMPVALWSLLYSAQLLITLSALRLL